MRWLSLAIALVAFAVGTAALVVTLTSSDDDVDSRVVELESEVADLVEAQESTAGSDAADLPKDLRKTTARLDKVEQCLPEIQNQLNNLEVSGEFAFTNSQVSSFCNELFFPTAPVGE